jgi:nickel-dependent lactate racemase
VSNVLLYAVFLDCMSAYTSEAYKICCLKLYLFVILQQNSDIIKVEHGDVLREHTICVENCEVYKTSAVTVKMDDPEVSHGFRRYLWFMYMFSLLCHK